MIYSFIIYSIGVTFLLIMFIREQKKSHKFYEKLMTEMKDHCIESLKELADQFMEAWENKEIK